MFSFSSTISASIISIFFFVLLWYLFFSQKLITIFLVKGISKKRPIVSEIKPGKINRIAAILLILPGFISDTIGFFLVVPFTRKIIINSWLKKKHQEKRKNEEEIIDAEIIEDKEDKNEL